MENTSQGEGSQAGLPDTGKFTLKRWSEITGVEERKLKDNLRKLKIRVIRLGDAWFIDAAMFWADLAPNEEEPE